MFESREERRDHERLRMIHLLEMMATERTGWRSFVRRWYFSDEPLRNSAADLLRDIGHRPILRYGTRLVGDDALSTTERQP